MRGSRSMRCPRGDALARQRNFLAEDNKNTPDGCPMHAPRAPGGMYVAAGPARPVFTTPGGDPSGATPPDIAG